MIRRQTELGRLSKNRRAELLKTKMCFDFSDPFKSWDNERTLESQARGAGYTLGEEGKKLQEDLMSIFWLYDRGYMSEEELSEYTMKRLLPRTHGMLRAYDATDRQKLPEADLIHETHGTDDDKWEIWKCSECGELFNDPNRRFAGNFCRMCGARFRGLPKPIRNIPMSAMKPKENNNQDNAE